jgi:hypothetical protein
MFCHACGAQIQPGFQHCVACGAALGGLQAPRMAPAQSRVSGHVRTLGILWIVASAFRILPLMGLHWFWPFRSAI